MLGPNPGLDVGCCGIAWLDKLIEEQAAYYGLTPEQHKKLFDAVAEYDEEHPEL